MLQLTPTDKLGAPATDTAIVSDVPAPATKPAPEGASPAPSSKKRSPRRGDDAGARKRISSRTAAAIRARRRATACCSAIRGSARTIGAATFRAVRRTVGSISRLQAEAPAEPKQQMAAAPAPASAPDPFPAAPKVAADAAPAASGNVSPRRRPPRAEVAANASRERDSLAALGRSLRSVAAPAASRMAERASAAPAPPPAPSPRWPRDARPTAASDEARAKDRTPLPVPDWIALIRRLRAEGKQAEAAKELAAFRAAHPDHEKLLPPDLRDWRPPEK